MRNDASLVLRALHTESRFVISHSQFHIFFTRAHSPCTCNRKCETYMPHVCSDVFWCVLIPFFGKGEDWEHKKNVQNQKWCDIPVVLSNETRRRQRVEKWKEFNLKCNNCTIMMQNGRTFAKKYKITLVKPSTAPRRSPSTELPTSNANLLVPNFILDTTSTNKKICTARCVHLLWHTVCALSHSHEKLGRDWMRLLHPEDRAPRACYRRLSTFGLRTSSFASRKFRRGG